MSDVDLMVREKHDIPDDEDTLEWCKRNGLDYSEELWKAFFSAWQASRPCNVTCGHHVHI